MKIDVSLVLFLSLFTVTYASISEVDQHTEKLFVEDPFLNLDKSSSFINSASSKKIVIIGGASDIGQELVKILLSKDHTVVAADDDSGILQDMQKRYGTKLITRVIPIINTDESRVALSDIIEELEGMDICILCCSIAPEIDDYGILKDKHIPWMSSKETIETNVLGITALANVALNHFLDKKKGILVGISSLDALFGHPGCPCYTASKAFMSNYLEAMRQRFSRVEYKEIAICDIRWSFVSQIKDSLGAGWTESPEEAALQMLKAIEAKKPVAYIMSRWSFVLWALTAVPSLIRNAASGVSVLKHKPKINLLG